MVQIVVILIWFILECIFQLNYCSKHNILYNSPTVIVNPTHGNFSIYLKNQYWFESDEVFLRMDGLLYTTKDKSLTLDSIEFKDKQNDRIGNYDIYCMLYSIKNQPLLKASIKIYQSAIIFEQQFDSAIQGTSTGNADNLITGFPTFNILNDHFGDGYAHWVSWYYESTMPASNKFNQNRKMLVAPGFETPVMGSWGSETVLQGGIGGSGVTAIFDQNLTTVAILSPFQNAMAMSHISPQSGSLQFGIMGNVTNIPADTIVSTMLYFGSEGEIHRTMSNWGELMRSFYNKPDATVARSKDVTLQYIGYTTDNGAYYYYNTGGFTDYETTLVEVKKYSDSIGIPYKYVLLDSWWYFKGENGGVSDWSARPEVFPNGIESLFEKTGWLVQAHNRYWAYDNVYATQNNGSYQFILDEIKNGAAPTDPAFWKDLFAGPVNQWGLVVYEQDWLFNEFYEYVSPFLESIGLGRQWLLQMGEGAKQNNISIQYCMPFIRHLLQSLEVSAATQARASDDYVVSPYTGPANWKIAGQSMLIDALGLAPSKDGYWSTTVQSNNPYGEERTEPFPRLQSAVCVLSAGPIAIADGVGYSDAELIMKSCMKDGRLLQPTVPAALIDSVFLGRALGNEFGPSGEIWIATSSIQTKQDAKKMTFGFLFAAEIADDFVVRPSHVAFELGVVTGSEKYIVYEKNMTTAPRIWSESNPLTLTACGSYDFALWTISPVVKDLHKSFNSFEGWSFLGELNKWTAVSSARFKDIHVTMQKMRIPGIIDGKVLDTMMHVTAFLTAQEVLTVGFVHSLYLDHVVYVQCTAPGQSAGWIQISSDRNCTPVQF